MLSLVVSYWTEGKFQIWHTVAQTGSGTMFPIFVMLPFVPYDHDLAEALIAEPLGVLLAGLLGAGVSIYALFYTNERTRNPYIPPRRPK